MLTRKQALLTLALMTSVPAAVWAADAVKTDPVPPAPAACPFAPDDMPMHKGKMKGRDGKEDGPRAGMMMGMNDTDALKAQLDDIKDPKVKAKFIEMIKARLDFEQSKIESTRTFLNTQK